MSIPPEWRGRIYVLVSYALPLLAGYGLIEENDVALWVGLAGGILGTGLAAVNTPKKKLEQPSPTIGPLGAEIRDQAEQARDSFVERTEQVGDDLAARAAELASSLSTLRADTRTGFVQLPDGTRARIQLSVTPER